MVHERFDVQEWIARFPLDEEKRKAREFVEQRRLRIPDEYPDQQAVDDHIAGMSPGGEIVCSPRDIAVTEQIRRQALAGRKLKGIPTDIFVFGRGETSRPEATKLGGVPYWPASQEWPHGADGKPLVFIAQFCFADSRDIVGKLPCDVLLIFGQRDGDYLELDASELEFFWRDMGDKDLIKASAMPQVDSPVAPFYGVIYRTFDFPDAKPSFKGYNDPELLAVLEGTKIGGRPRWIQDPEPLADRFLCALGSLGAGDQPYPFVNVPEPVDAIASSLNGPMWGDMGSLYIFVDKDGRLDATVQCY